MNHLKCSYVAIGLNIGEIWFWDLNTSKFLTKDYDKLYRHDMKVRCIIEITHPKRKIEYLITASDDGVILVWMIGEEDMKQAKKNEKEKNLEKYEASLNIFCAKNTFLTNNYIEKLSYNELEELNKNLLKDIYNFEEDQNEKSKDKKEGKEKEKRQKLYKPEVKYSIIVPQLLNTLDRKDNQIYTLTYIKDSYTFFSAGENAIIHVWNLESGNLMDKMIVRIKNYPLNSLFRDMKHLLIVQRLTQKICYFQDHKMEL